MKDLLKYVVHAFCMEMAHRYNHRYPYVDGPHQHLAP